MVCSHSLERFSPCFGAEKNGCRRGAGTGPNRLTVGSDVIEVTYTLEKNDYLQFNGFVINRAPALKRQSLLRFLGLPALIAGESYFFHLPLAWYLVSVPAFTGIWALYLLWAQRRAVIAQTQARIGALGLHTISLQSDGLYNQTSVLDTRVKWQHITEVTDNPQMIVLFLSPRYGFLVPKRAFLTTEQAQAFLQTARAYRQSAFDGTVLTLPSLPPSWPPAPQRML